MKPASLSIPFAQRLLGRPWIRVALFFFVISSSLMAASGPARPQELAGGTVSGRVFDGATGSPLANATVILGFPDLGDGSEPRQEVATTGPAGDYEFGAMPAGIYNLSFIKSGYRASAIANFEIKANEDNVADFPMPRSLATAATPGGGGGDVLELEAFVVEASVVGDLMNNLELRLDSDQQVNLLSAADLSKFAASDVADALKRVAGVNVVEGQFAVVRGLEDRYSSTLYNGAPVPSPDPDSQSVQLDLFPSDVVTNLLIGKNFTADAPSNSAGGSINILTQDYPEETQLKISVGAGFEEEARNRFLDFQRGSTAGTEASEIEIAETDVGGSLGGRIDLPWVNRELRFKGVINHEIDYRTQVGFQESREPTQADPQRQRSGGLSLGELALSGGKFDQTQSTREEQLTAYLSLGIDLDREGKHKVDASYFYTQKKQETVELRENGFFSELDYSGLVQATIDEDLDSDFLRRQLEPVATFGSRLAFSRLREEISDAPSRGAAWFANFGRTNSFDQERDLQVYQLNGKHEFDLFEGLEVSWVANRAVTSQEQESLGMRFFYEPCGFESGNQCPAGTSRTPIPTQFPSTVASLGPGRFFASGTSGGIIFSENTIDEAQWFSRFDFDQELEPFSFLLVNLKAGFWWERSKRDVEALFVENVTINTSTQWLQEASSLEELGGNLFNNFDSARGDRFSTTNSEREITSGYASAKMTFWEDLDLFGGVRFEQIQITSENDPFTGEFNFGRPSTFPVTYLFFDRQDNPDPAFQESFPLDPENATFNDQILGINVPVNPTTGFVDLLTREEILSLVNGEIDEFKVLPSVGLTYRPFEGLTIRGSYSETVARPSFREIGYYVTTEPGTDEQTVGNPQLQLSEVRSYDARAEYVFGDLGDLVAFSAFYKTIDRPIESIFVRNPLNNETGSEALFRTFFNNPDVARLWGIEFEARKSFDFLPALGIDFPGVDVFDYLSIGGNFTYISAKVGRTEAELARSRDFFGIVDPNDTELFTSLRRTRRLFGQPEWIANADVTFNHPDWGTTATLAIFAISDVLEAAGTANVGRSGQTEEATLDRYFDAFYQLDFVVSQRIWQGLNAKMCVKNLTNSKRRRVYDPRQTSRRYVERSRQSGRDWSFSLSYSFEF